MKTPIRIEVIGLKDSSCSPFPCDMTRSCGLYECHPSGKLVPAFGALQKELDSQYPGKLKMELILIDERMPVYVREIIAVHYPPLPFILINGVLVPMGRISLPMLQKEIEKYIPVSGDS